MSVERKTYSYLATGSLLGDFLDKFHAYDRIVRTAFRAKDTEAQIVVTDAHQINVLEQNLPLNVTTPASARRAAKLMMPHLAPMPADTFVWDIIGPSKANVDGKHNYTLGFVRLDDLTQLGGELRDVKTESGSTYSFTSDAHLVVKRKKVLFQMLGFITCYCALLWAGFAWSERPSHIAQNWQSEARQLRSETSRLQNTSQILENQSVLINMYQGGSQSVNVLSVLSVASQTLPDAGWIQQLNSTDQQIKLNGLTDDTTILVTLLESKPTIVRVELGVVSADRATGLERFVLTVFLGET